MQYVGSMNRAQQAYRVENKEFTNELDQLYLGIDRETENYKYLIRATDSATFHYAISKQDDLESYIGAVFFAVYPDTQEEITLTIMCEAAEPGKVIPAEPQVKNGVPTCSAGTERLWGAILLGGSKLSSEWKKKEK